LPETILYQQEELLGQIAAGNEEAFTTFFHHYISIIKPFVFSFTKSDAVADELVQDIFLRVGLSRDKLPEIEAPRAWLFKIAANECYRYLRKQVVENKMTAQLAADYEDATDSTETHINVQEIKNLVATIVSNLSPQRKRIYQLSREAGMKIEEIATELQLSPNTVKNVLVTTAKIVRERLQQAGYYLPLSLVMLLLQWQVTLTESML
jgi:RNA polymerase sigma-70 factor (ECF subfamily)